MRAVVGDSGPMLKGHFINTLRFRSIGVLAPGRLPLGLLPLSVRQALFKGTHVVRPVFAESVPVQIGDEDREWSLPRLLLVIVQPAELLGIEPQLACHLDVGMREVEARSRLHPRLVLR